MRNELDGKFLLGVAGKIEKLGSAVQNEFGAGFCLDGVTMNSSFDGYEVYLSNGKVQLTIGFHHKWHCDAKSEAEMDEFVTQLKKIDQYS